MNSIDPFREIYRILNTTSTEHIILSLGPLTERTYQSIFDRASQMEQEQLAEYKKNAQDAARTITTLPTDSQEIPKLRLIAIRNIRLIRHTQQLMALFDGFDESVNAEYFKKSVSQIPTEDRIDCVAKALSAKNQLVCPFKRKKLVELLASNSPDARSDTKDALVSMLQKCPGRNYENMLTGFSTLVNRDERGSFMQDLSRVLAMIDVRNWCVLKEALVHSTESRRALLVRHICQIVSPTLTLHLDTGELTSIIRNVKMRLNNPEVLTASAEITSRCTNATYIPLILQVLCQQTEAERTSVISFLRQVLPASLDSNSIYQALREACQMTTERRNEILNELRQIQNNPLRGVFVIFGAQNMAGLEEQFAAMALDRYTLEVDRDDLKNYPLNVLNTLYTLFKNSPKRALHVKFIGEPSIDAGGPGQEFITSLVEEVCKILTPAKDQELLFRPYMRTAKQEHRKALKQLGALLIFCLHSSANYVIGKRLDPALFEALCRLDKELIATDFTDMDKERFDALFAILEAMNSTNEEDQAAIARMKAYMQDHEAPLEPIIEAIRESLEPCFLLYKGMLETQFPVDILAKMKPQALEEALQGSLNPAQAVKQLNVKASTTVHECVQEWILGLSSEQLKHFLRLIAGTPALNKRMLNIEFSGDAIKFTTCTQTLTLPESALESQKALTDMLEFALKTKLKFTMK